MTQTTRPISPLRQRMLDDMRMRKLSDTTQGAFPAVSGEGHCSPDFIPEE